MSNWISFPKVLEEVQKNPSGLEGVKGILQEKKEEMQLNGVECKNCERNRITSMIEIEKMKNNFIIVWKEMKKEEESIR